jgi:hypothetical protein
VETPGFHQVKKHGFHVRREDWSCEGCSAGFGVGTEVEAGPSDPSTRTNENGVVWGNGVGWLRSGKVGMWRIRWQVRMAVGWVSLRDSRTGNEREAMNKARRM